MMEAHNVGREAQRSLNRILPRVEGNLKAEIKNDRLSWKQFTSRLHVYFFLGGACYMQICIVIVTISLIWRI
jgi:hypothetical protein